MSAKITFGIQTEICGGIEPASAKVRNNMKKMIKIKDSTNPMAICNPVPPRLLRAETITPMNTRIKIVTGDANVYTFQLRRLPHLLTLAFSRS